MQIKEEHQLRKPSGPHFIGCTKFCFTYKQEKNRERARIIPCLCFYPTQGAGEGEQKKYVNASILPGASGIATNSYFDAPVSDGRHPVLLFNHGYGLFCEANTVQFEELAANGYIVLSIGHQGEGLYELPGGETLPLDPEMLEDFAADSQKNMETFFKYSSWLCSEGKNAGIKEHRDYYKDLLDNQPIIQAHSEVWLKDNLVALEMFLDKTRQPSDLMHNHVDIDNIGAFGMSFGGSVALYLNQVSDLIKAGADLDGFFYSSVWEKPIAKPILLLQNDGPFGHLLTFPFLNAEKDAYLLTVKDSAHNNFNDYNEILAENEMLKISVGDEEIELGLLGRINPDQMGDIINSWLLDFFNKHLRNKPARLINTPNLSAEIFVRKK